MAKEIEFDLRRLDQEQQDEEEGRSEQEEPAGVQEAAQEGQEPDINPNQEENRKETIQSLGSSPKLPSRTTPLDKDQSLSSPAPSGKTVAPRNELHRQAIMNSKARTARRKSIAIAPCDFSDNSSQDNSVPGTSRARRASVSDFRQTAETSVTTQEKDQSHVDPRPVGSYPLPEEKEKTTHTPVRSRTTREELMRAISTPHPEDNVISNITFVNESQEVSAISMNSTIPSTDTVNNQEPKLLLHFKSPEAYAQETEFSRIRKSKSTRRSLSSDLNKVSHEVNKEPRKSGGLFESYASEAPESDEESADQSEPPTPSVSKKGKKHRSASRGNTKRTRDMAALSPDPTKAQANKQIPKPSQKRSKRKNK